MAQGGIKKGFFFYFGLFVLLLISVFCICLVIMMFSPGSTILWMQYFSGNETVHIVQTNDDSKKDIPWGELSGVNITCDNYAEVVLERNADPSLQKYSKEGYDQSGIYIVNNAKGFTTASSAKPFSYNIYILGSVLHVDIQEPTGFLFLSKQVKVVLHATTQAIATNNTNWDFSNLDITVTTKDGNVNIGGSKIANAKEIKPRSLAITTTSGDIAFTEEADLSNVKTFSLVTENGTITSQREVNYGAGTGKGISLNCDAKLAVNGRGKIDCGVINAPSSMVTLTCKSGSWDIGVLNANQTQCVDCENGNYLFGTVYGDLRFNSQDSLITPNIRIKVLENNFFLEATAQGSRPSVEIDEAIGEIVMTIDNGSLKVKKAQKSLNVIGQDEVKVDVLFDEKISGTAVVTNKRGDVRLGFLGEFFRVRNSRGVYVFTDTGNVNIDFTEKAVFDAVMYENKENADGSRTLLGDDKISVNIPNNSMVLGDTKNPLQIRGTLTTTYTRPVEIVTNNKVSFNCKPSASLTA